MRFAPAELTVKPGETVRVRLTNSGKVMHEMVLGTMRELEAHAEMMRKEPAMHHHGATACTEADPRCGVCPLLGDCPFGLERTRSAN